MRDGMIAVMVAVMVMASCAVLIASDADATDRYAPEPLGSDVRGDVHNSQPKETPGLSKIVDVDTLRISIWRQPEPTEHYYSMVLGTTFDCNIVASNTDIPDYVSYDDQSVRSCPPGTVWKVNPGETSSSVRIEFKPSEAGSYVFVVEDMVVNLDAVEVSDPHYTVSIFDTDIRVFDCPVVYYRYEPGCTPYGSLEYYAAYGVEPNGYSLYLDSSEWLCDGKVVYKTGFNPSMKPDVDRVLRPSYEVTLGKDADEHIRIPVGMSLKTSASDVLSAPVWFDGKKGTPLEPGTYEITVKHKALLIGRWGPKTFTVEVVEDPSLGITVFDSMGGSGEYMERQGDTELPSPGDRPGYAFTGWYTAEAGGTRLGGVGDAYPPESSAILYAGWTEVPLEITSDAPTEPIVVGNTFAYDVVTSLPGATLDVTGASWLSVNGNRLVGTPVQTGTYTVVLTAAYGTQTDSQTFEVRVVERLGFESAPTGSILISPVV